MTDNVFRFIPGRALLSGFAVWLSLLGAARADDPVDSTDAQSESHLAATVKDILRSRCYDCHGGNSIQLDISVLDHAALLKNAVVVPGKPDESSLYRAITETNESVRMPEGQPPLTAMEIDTIRQWILASAPEFPVDIEQPKEMAREDSFSNVAGVEYVLKEILAHQRTLSADDRRFIRYFSCHHLLVLGVTRETIENQFAAFAKAINHLSREPHLLRPTVVNGEIGTIFAVDIRKLGWQKQPFKTVGGANAKSSLNLYDLVLLEYPYAIAYEDSVIFDSLVSEYLLPAHLVRPIPFVRSDWFCSVVTQPPLYHDLLQLPRELTDLERELGIAVEENLTHRLAQRAGMTISGVSRNNRAVERHPYAHGAYWKSIDFASSKGSENIFTDPVRLQGAGGEMIYNLPNGLQAYYITDAQGHRIDDAPTSVVTDKFAENKTVRNGLACIRCHDRGMKEFRDDVRPAVEGITGSGKINKREVLALYPPHKEMRALVEQDRLRFLRAMEQLLGNPRTIEPLTEVSQRFLDAPLHLPSVAGELGYAATGDLKAIFLQPQFTALGLISLGNSGVIRRDMWEDYFDHVVRGLGLGIPLIPLDGNMRQDYLPSDSPINVTLSTNRKNNIFAPGDEMTIFVENLGRSLVFIELVGTSAKGEKVIIIPAGTKLESSKKLRFPETGTLRVKDSLGKEFITVLASEAAVPAGEILRGTNIDDRFVHPFYKVESKDGVVKVGQDATKVIKRTIALETR